ncbi:tape measure domain-containing protein [Kibdelosporangium aridum]|uniref:Tape measure domain-containing protein n=1 Tax=Kibdelosporangium aridum TaxID=2030 RepID=A0A428YUY8_KIBAR|nr:tape measure domain-containing protein [Kibdelosporangium aridum]RSM73449.1 tape measure domain-containing protein [Kibdelosporangium aridum]
MARGVEIGRGYIAVEVDENGARAALRGFVGFAGSAFKAAAATAAVLTGAAAKIGIEFNSMKEQAQVAFSTLLGSGEKAQAFLENLTKFAAQTPFELPGLIDNARSLLGVGLAADKVIPTMSALGNAAGALGLNQDAFNRVMIATVQAMGKGKLQGDELLQMVEAGIPVWNLLSKATGKTVPELQKMSEQGKLLSADVLPKLFDQMNQDYGGAMAAQSKTLAGQWSSLKDNARILAATGFKPIFDEAKNVVGALGELAASDKGKEFAEKFANGLAKGIDAAKIFGTSLKREFGDDARRVFNQLKDSAGEAWDTFKADGVPTLKALAQAALSVLPALLQLAQAAGGILMVALQAASIVMQAIADNADELASGIRTAASVVGAIAGPALQIFGAALKVAAEALAGLVNFVGALSGPLGVVAGLVIAGTLAWRVFGTTISTVGAALGALKPSAVADALGGMTKRIDNVSLSAGVMTERITGSANAGEKVAVAGSKMGNAMAKVGSVLPVVGLGFAAVGAIWGVAAQRAEDLKKAAEDIGRGLAVGGTAAQNSAKRLEELRRQVESAKTAMKGLADTTPTYSDRSGVAAAKTEELRRKMSDAQAQIDGAKQELLRYQAELGPVGLAQARVSQAQTDYNSAVQQFGPTSSQAISAQKVLVAETAMLERQQIAAARATKSHEQALYDLASQALASANADLQLRQSRAAITDAEKAYADAVKTHGLASNEATQAGLNLEASYLRAAEAARQKAIADNAGKSSSDQASAANAAYANEILRMASAAGNNAPASLQKLVGGLGAAELQAIGAKVKVDEFGNAIIQVPGLKDIKITAENAAALREIARVQQELAEAQARAQITMRVRVERGLPAVSDTKLKRVGGPIVANNPYIVNDGGPELIFPDRSGYVATAKQTESIMAGLNASSGTKIEQNNYFSGPMDEAAYATQASQQMAWMAKTGGR